MSRPVSAEVARLIDLRNVFDGDVVEHRPEARLTLLRWRGRMLEALYQPAFDAGAPIARLVPPGGIVLHRRDRPSRGEHENPLPGRVADGVALGLCIGTASTFLGVAGGELLIPTLIFVFSAPTFIRPAAPCCHLDPDRLHGAVPLQPDGITARPLHAAAYWPADGD